MAVVESSKPSQQTELNGHKPHNGDFILSNFTLAGGAKIPLFFPVTEFTDFIDGRPVYVDEFGESHIVEGFKIICLHLTTPPK